MCQPSKHDLYWKSKGGKEPKDSDEIYSAYHACALNFNDFAGYPRMTWERRLETSVFAHALLWILLIAGAVDMRKRAQISWKVHMLVSFAL